MWHGRRDWRDGTFSHGDAETPRKHRTTRNLNKEAAEDGGEPTGLRGWLRRELVSTINPQGTTHNLQERFSIERFGEQSGCPRLLGALAELRGVMCGNEHDG